MVKLSALKFTKLFAFKLEGAGASLDAIPATGSIGKLRLDVITVFGSGRNIPARCVLLAVRLALAIETCRPVALDRALDQQVARLILLAMQAAKRSVLDFARKAIRKPQRTPQRLASDGCLPFAVKAAARGLPVCTCRQHDENREKHSGSSLTAFSILLFTEAWS